MVRRKMSEEDEFGLRRGWRREEEATPRDPDDPYIRDENGRPVDLLKKGGRRPSSRKVSYDAGLRKYLIIGGVFTGVLAISGHLLAALIVGVSTFAVALVVKMRR